MKDGYVSEQGFRSDLMQKSPTFGVFADMAAEQADEPLPPKMEEWRDGPEDEEILDIEDVDDPTQDSVAIARPSSFGLQLGNAGYLDILDEYIRGGRSSVVENKRDSILSRPLSMAQKRLSWSPQDLDAERPGSRTSTFSLRPWSRASHQYSIDRSPNISNNDADKYVQVNPTEKDLVNTLPYSRTTNGLFDDDQKKRETLTVVTQSPCTEGQTVQSRGIFALITHFFPALPSKHLLFIGIVGSVGHGVSTPIWASYLSKLMQIVGSGGTSPSLTKNGIIVLSLCAIQALADFTQEYCLYALAARWTTSVRGDAFSSVLAQDKAWFDETGNSPSRLVQCLIKDADDMRALMGNVIGKLVVFIAMVGFGIIWAMIVDWRLTLIGVSLVPVFAAIMLVNDALIGQAEVANKAKREAMARTFYEVSEAMPFAEGLILFRVSRISAGSGRWHLIVHFERNSRRN